METQIWKSCKRHDIDIFITRKPQLTIQDQKDLNLKHSLQDIIFLKKLKLTELLPKKRNNFPSRSFFKAILSESSCK